MSKTFNFKKFSITRTLAGMKLTTDAVLQGCWTAKFFPNRKTVIDVGTGTGILSLLYAQFTPECQICGIDIEPGAISDAGHNFSQSSFNKTSFSTLQTDFLKLDCKELPWQDQTELIVCNPPYFPEHNNSGCSNKARYTARHVNTLPIDDFMTKSADTLKENGVLAIMIPVCNASAYISSATANGLNLEQFHLISSVINKEPYLALLGFKKSTVQPKKQEPTHDYLFEQETQNSPRRKSVFWQQLTQDVYLK